MFECNVKSLEEMSSAERVEMDSRMSKPAFAEVKPSASYILDRAKGEQFDRAQFYDAPVGERSMAKAVTMFNALYGTQLTEVQGWQFMTVLKMVRASQGAARLDNFVDGASYFALAGEAAMKD